MGSSSPSLSFLPEDDAADGHLRGRPARPPLDLARQNRPASSSALSTLGTLRATFVDPVMGGGYSSKPSWENEALKGGGALAWGRGEGDGCIWGRKT
ncbi:hypothetical protein ZWY2020_026204 [Hordeum vulgare]|nr:hypothetical protein ZWY2020_026204 [Hordeum vulgare]